MRGLVAGCLLALALLVCTAFRRPRPPKNTAPGCAGARPSSTGASTPPNSSGPGFSSDYENSPQTVLGLTGVTQVKAGFKFGLALLGNCTVESWGTGNKGQLGNGGQQTESHPVAVTGLTEVKEIAVANAHAMALRYDGTVWTWGASEFGERGNKEKGFERTARQTESWFVARDHPTEVPGLTGVKQIAAGGTRDYALLADGEVMAWGEDRNGELGVEEKRVRRRTLLRRTPRHHARPVQHRSRGR